MGFQESCSSCGCAEESPLSQIALGLESCNAVKQLRDDFILRNSFKILRQIKDALSVSEMSIYAPVCQKPCFKPGLMDVVFIHIGWIMVCLLLRIIFHSTSGEICENICKKVTAN